MARAPKQEILYQEKLIAGKYLRFATPADVAKYRAERLYCNIIAEIGAGIGGQTIAFAEKCRKVIADFRFLPKRIQRKYLDLGVVPSYVLGICTQKKPMIKNKAFSKELKG